MGAGDGQAVAGVGGAHEGELQQVVRIGLHVGAQARAELAKIGIVIFLASYLREHRELLVVGARRILGITFPPIKHLGPLLVVWGAAMFMLIFIRDLGSSLMFFAAFLALIYVATGRLSFVIIGMAMFLAGAWVIYHGTYGGNGVGRSFLGRVRPDGTGRTEIAFPEEDTEEVNVSNLPSVYRAIWETARKHDIHDDITKRIVAMFGLSLAGFALLGWLSGQAWFYQGLGVQPGIGAPNDALALLLFLLVAPVFGYFVSPLLANLSRRHEFQADAYACAQASGADLAAALLKLHEDNASTLTPDPVYVKFYYSHPPASERLAAMQRGVGAPA